MRVEDAVEVFVRAFAFTRSLTHPYVVERFEGAWVIRDGPGGRSPYNARMSEPQIEGRLDTLERTATRVGCGTL